MKTINALKARSRLGTILDDVSQGGEHYIIERLSVPLVAVLPVEEYQLVFKQNSSKKRGDELFHELDSFRQKYGKKLSGKKGTIHLLHEMRQKRIHHIGNFMKDDKKNS